jgi:hypothetical protein
MVSISVRIVLMCYNEEVLEDVVASVEDQVPVDQSLLLHICSSLTRYLPVRRIFCQMALGGIR